MSWAGIATNQCVSRNNLQDAVNNGVFTLKNSIPAGTKQITKNEAEYYVNLNTSYAPLAAKTFNQLVVKSNLQGCINLPYAYTLYFDYSDGSFAKGLATPSAACSAVNSFTVYSSSSTVTVGMALYFDSCGTEQIYAYSYDSPYDKYYRIGSSYVTFENWDGTGYGYVIRTINACGGGSSATIDWGVGNQNGANLKIINNVGTILRDITSTVGSAQYGTVSIPDSQLPYTIRGSWVSGSGNIVQFRVCDLYGTELYYSGPITIGGSADYTPSPTPVYVSVYLTGNNVTPPFCLA